MSRTATFRCAAAGARAALIDPAAALGREFEPGAIDALLKDTQGYPYFIQLYGDRLWKGSPASTITLADFRKLRPAILGDLGIYSSRDGTDAPRHASELC